jgi:hypothetical protein
MPKQIEKPIPKVDAAVEPKTNNVPGVIVTKPKNFKEDIKLNN